MTEQRITGADWHTWFRHLASAAIRGAAVSAKATGFVGAASAATQAKWEPSTIDMELLAYTALIGFVFAVIEFLAARPLPDGSEVVEIETVTTKINPQPVEPPTS